MSEQLRAPRTNADSLGTIDEQDRGIRDLFDLQIHIGLAAETVRAHGTSEFGKTDVGMQNQKSNLNTLSELLETLDTQIGSSGVLLIAGYPDMTGRRTPAEEQLLETYGVGKDQFGRQVLVIGQDQLTAHRSNPGFYGSGEAVAPVLDLRIQRSLDQPIYAPDKDTGALEYIPGSEMWVQLPLEQIQLAVAN